MLRKCVMEAKEIFTQRHHCRGAYFKGTRNFNLTSYIMAIEIVALLLRNQQPMNSQTCIPHKSRPHIVYRDGILV